MEICINKRSGKYFIFIQNIDLDKRLVVTPIGEIKSLEDKHFSEPIDKDENFLLPEYMITKQQYETYKKHKKNRDDEQTEEFLLKFEALDPWEQKRFIRKILQKKTEHTPGSVGGNAI
jgi:hypothetical protein